MLHFAYKRVLKGHKTLCSEPPRLCILKHTIAFPRPTNFMAVCLHIVNLATLSIENNWPHKLRVYHSEYLILNK